MSKTVLHDGDDGVLLIVRDKKPRPKSEAAVGASQGRTPVHVIYGGANLFNAGTARKLGDIALKTFDTYFPDPAEFAAAFLSSGATPQKGKLDILKAFAEDPEKLRSTNYPAWLAGTVHQRTRAKLQTEPIEDLRIDFEDGYGFRADEEEDADARRAARELADALGSRTITHFSGIRVKSYAKETRERAKRTLNIFLEEMLDSARGKLPKNFVVTLPKVTDRKEVKELCRDLRKIEKNAGLNKGTIRIEIMVEHPFAIFDDKGRTALQRLVKAGRGRCVAAHFGAYDYTSSLGIAASEQDIGHPACELARQMMLICLQPHGIRLSDSITTRIPVPVHKSGKLDEKQKTENRNAMFAAWAVHFANIRRSMANGFYQSWDLHPNQLIARYAAVYSFYLEAFDPQAARLRSFLDKAAQATLTGHEFDDAASAIGIVNFFRRGLECGALSGPEIEKATGLAAAEFRSNSILDIFSGKIVR